MGLFTRDPQVAAHSAAEIIEAIRGSPPVVAALADATSRRIAERQNLVDTLASADRAAGTNFPVLTADIDASIAAERKAEGAWRKAGERVAAAGYARTSASVALDRLRSQVESTLRAGADNLAIDGFLAWARDDLDSTRKIRGYGFSTSTTKGDEVTVTTESRQASILRRIEATTAAMADVDKLRFVADQSGVPATVASLKNALPAIAADIVSVVKSKPPKSAPLYGVAAGGDSYDPISQFIEIAGRK